MRRLDWGNAKRSLDDAAANAVADGIAGQGRSSALAGPPDLTSDTQFEVRRGGVCPRTRWLISTDAVGTGWRTSPCACRAGDASQGWRMGGCAACFCGRGQEFSKLSAWSITTVFLVVNARWCWPLMSATRVTTCRA